MNNLGSDFIKVIDNFSRDTIVYFSSVNVPKGKFNGTSVVKGLNANFIFVNCDSNSWYVAGIPGLGNNFWQVAETLQKLTDNLNRNHEQSRTLYFGGSMGGYGALLYGCLNNADNVIATGVEINLSKEHGYAATLSTINFKSIELPDFQSILNKSRASVDLIFGENSPEDFYDISMLSSLDNVSLYSIPNCGHKVPLSLEKSLGVKHILEQTLLGQKPFRSINGKLCNYPFILKMLSGLVELDCNYFLAALENRNDIDSSVKALMHEKLGDFFHKENLSQAIHHYKLAIHFNPFSYNSYIGLSQIYLKERSIINFKSNLEAAISLIKINKTDSIEYLYYLLAKGLYELNEFDHARQIISNSLELIAENSQLGRLVNSLKIEISNKTITKNE